jgi:SagB-type dehydrogenase family enzyme
VCGRGARVYARAVGNRDLEAIRRYHEETKHSLASLRHSRHSLDWEIMPRPFKVYPDLEPVPLPHDFVTSTRPALAAVADPGTAAPDAPVDRAALARLLFFSAGVLRRKTYPGGEIYFRAAACTGALYHIDLYLVTGSLSDLEPGVWHFGPHDFALRRLRPGDHRRALVDAAANEPAVAGAPAVLALATTFWRNAWKYQARAWRHAFWDGGTIAANLLAVAAAAGPPARLVLGYADAPVNRLLGLDPAREATIALVPLGRGATPPAEAPPAPPLDLATLPLSAREVDYPAIRAAHAASSLEPAEVASWRGAPPERTTPAAGALAPLPRTATDSARQPIERVILRRGSARAFAPDPLTKDELATILWTATRGIPADCTAPSRALADPYLIVHAVEGLDPGTYAYDRRAHALLPLRCGAFRTDAAHLGLGQTLPAEAAVNVYWLADLDPVLERFGNRGYRAAQLEAAIEGGKTYLAAYALGLGATGLTFFDDDVTAFFSPHARGKSVMFLIAVGHRRRLDRPRR